ncbi:conserved hypothetical protein [Xanthomonas citri pv. fuscans]|nr:conserved hypothetical protein [Xanthomonas citri pv. fuscans]SOO18703.1 conserved hypothetical protein [Xanthomonas citri pv. fuscans]SOO21791.1 conserved hypothetical protein [Xanthomonas citri pv. fuscans]SOO32678.1 conserved hypothetical protein [Xanthomonas citri pv. fuscans]
MTSRTTSSDLHLKERRNSVHSGTHLRQTGGFFVPVLQVQADAMPTSGGRLIQHSFGRNTTADYARFLTSRHPVAGRRRCLFFVGGVVMANVSIGRMGGRRRSVVLAEVRR